MKKYLIAAALAVATIIPATAGENDVYAALSNGTPACETAIRDMRVGGVEDGDPTHAAMLQAKLALLEAIETFERDNDKANLVPAIERHINASMAQSEALERHRLRWHRIGTVCDKSAITTKREYALIKEKIDTDGETTLSRKFLLATNAL